MTQNPHDYRLHTCLASHPGGFGDCLRTPNHDGPHGDARFNEWTDHEAALIIDERITLRREAALMIEKRLALRREAVARGE